MLIPPNKIILMTALVPTIGHKFLIDFARNLSFGMTHVIISGRSFEPINPYDRLNAIESHYYDYRNDVVFHLHMDDNAPQEPKDAHDKEFWQYWKNVVTERVKVKPNDYFVASEFYGNDMAEVLNCKFMPCDIGREVIPIKGTTVRHGMLSNFDKILPEMQHKFAKHIVLFGQESTGKTTMARKLSKMYNGTFVPEWARTYLEAVGPEVTMEKMEAIVHGQAALEDTARNHIDKKLLTFYDTDLLSTIGYYKLWSGNIPENIAPKLIRTFQNHKADLYFVMCDSIPFEPDPLRYGDGKRESTKQFWIDLLQEYDCNFVIVSPGTHEAHANFCRGVINAFIDDEFKDLRNFQR
jgi:NadR type nicotinamide-nucleotide adenylyltransferase